MERRVYGGCCALYGTADRNYAYRKKKNQLINGFVDSSFRGWLS
jgi:hypothetical protein